MRFYFSEYLGTGTQQDTFRTPFIDMQGTVPKKITTPYKSIDIRPYQMIEDGYAAVWGNFTDAEHAAAIEYPEVHYLPFEAAGGSVVALNQAISSVSAANRTTLLNIMAQVGVPTAGITATWTVAQVMRQVQRRIMARLIMNWVDFDDLTVLVSTIPTLKLKAAKRALTNYGLDVSNITGAMTVEAALLVIFGQAQLDSLIDSDPNLAVS